METDSTVPSASSATRAAAQVLYKLHPLVIMNISEHWTRLKAESRNKKDLQIVGVILGVLDGRMVELQNTFAVPFELTDQKVPLINEEYFKLRGAQYKEVFPELELLGWYTVGGEQATESDAAVHRQFCQWIEAPLLAKFDVAQAVTTQKVPISLFECTATEPSQTLPLLRTVEWQLVSEESERIGINHVTRLSAQTTDDAQSELSKQLRATASATTMLKQRMQVVREYVAAVKDGRLPADQNILKEAALLMQQMPFVELDQFDHHFQAEQLDADMAIMVTEMTSLCGALTQMVSKMNVLALERSQMGGPGGGGGGGGGRGRGGRQNLVSFPLATQHGPDIILI